MLIDCDSCAMRAVRCDDCVVRLLLGPTVGAAGGAAARTSAVRAAGPGREPDRSGPPAQRLAVDNGATIDSHDDASERSSGPTVTVDPATARAGDFSTAERRALATLAAAGVIAPLGAAATRRPDTHRGNTVTGRRSLAG